MKIEKYRLVAEKFRYLRIILSCNVNRREYLEPIYFEYSLAIYYLSNSDSTYGLLPNYKKFLLLYQTFVSMYNKYFKLIALDRSPLGHQRAACSTQERLPIMAL